jgi:hypothetical protein
VRIESPDHCLSLSTASGTIDLKADITVVIDGELQIIVQPRTEDIGVPDSLEELGASECVDFPHSCAFLNIDAIANPRSFLGLKRPTSNPIKVQVIDQSPNLTNG